MAAIAFAASTLATHAKPAAPSSSGRQPPLRARYSLPLASASARAHHSAKSSEPPLGVGARAKKVKLAHPVRLSYPTLCEPPGERSAAKRAAVARAVQEAYGPDGIGLLLVEQVPGLVEARANLLPLAQVLAGLSTEQLEALEDPASKYGFGWSHGKETLAGGVPDFLKASFYANPLVDVPTTEPELLHKYPSYCRANIWPGQALPKLEPAFKELGRLVVQVGILVARECDEYVAQATTAGEGDGAALPRPRRLESIVRNSGTHKARLLHYFPPAAALASAAAAAPEPPDDAAWCGWHNDHGSLTGLTSALFTDESGRAVGPPCAEAGLYVRTRGGEELKVAIPEDCLAFQVGECAQVHSGGLLRATPHAVRAPRPAAAGAGARIGRNTFAVFMQPRWDEPMDPPPSHAMPELVAVPGWRAEQNFGEFTDTRLNQYYG